MGKTKHICEYCGKEYENYFKDSKFCSKECYKKYRDKNAKLKNHICPNCGRVFDARNWDTVYCSKKCSSEAHRNRIMCICDNCGKEYEIQKYKYDKSSRHFCSIECKRESMNWSKEDEEILRQYYGKLSYKEISQKIRRSIQPRSIYRKALALGIVEPANIWTDEEVKILVNNYSVKPMSEIKTLLPGRTQYAILGQAKKYGLKSYFYLNRCWTDEEIEYLKTNYIDKSYEDMSNEIGRTVVAIKVKMYLLNLHKPTEIINYDNLYNYVRQRLVPWRNKVREERNYTCEITGSKSNIIIHHIRGFNLLLEECIDILSFPMYDDFGLYSQEQLDDFMKSFLELQESYGEYICISESVHKEFHRRYGYGDNTLEQWNEFIKKILYA